MKLDVLEENVVDKLEDNDDLEFTIDKEDEWMIFKSFINYSDPIPSMVREITSNAFDAHIEIEVDEPVEVEIIDENILTGASCALSIRDRGAGMTPEIIQTIYSKFGKSTKRNNNKALGAFGFGAKAPLGYTNMFELITVAEGVKYHYAIHKGEKRPVITKLDEGPTDEDSGTEVKIIIKDGDKRKVKKAIQNSLTYFDNVNYINCDIDNNYQLIKGKDFIFNSQTDYSTFENAHLCLGKVRYPINWSAVGYDHQLTIPVGLYFDIGEIPVVWNRESVEYTETAIIKIRDKIVAVKEELTELYNKHHSDIDNLDDFLQIKSSQDIIVYKDDTIVYKVSDRRGLIAKTPTYSKYKYLKVRNNSSLFSIFKKDKFINSSGTTGYSSNYVDSKTIEKNTTFIPFGYTTSSIKDKYIASEYGSMYFLRPTSRKNGARDLITAFFDSHFKHDAFKEYTKDVRQAVIRESYELFDELVEYVKENSYIYSEIDVPQDYIDKQKELQSELEQEKEKEFYLRHASRHDSFRSERIRGGNLKQRFKNSTVIYGFRDDRQTLRKILKFIENELSYTAKDYVYVIQISQANERIIRNQLGDRAYHVGSELDKVEFIHRKGQKYNLKNWVLELKSEGLSKGISLYYNYSGSNIPNYITPEEPSLEEKKKIYKTVGKALKYPMLTYIGVSQPPDDILNEYKQQCPYYHVNPILIGKKYVKEYEDKRNKKQQSSDTDTGN